MLALDRYNKLKFTMNLKNISITIILSCLLVLTSINPLPGGVTGKLEERVRETQLPNGLKIVVVERSATPVFFALITCRVSV